MHVVLHVVHKVEQLGILGGVQLLDFPVEVVEQADIPARDDDDLQILCRLRELRIEIEHARHAEGACHHQDDRNIGIEPFAGAKRLLGLAEREAVKGGDAQRIDLVLGNAVFLAELALHLRLREHKGVDVGADVGAVGVVVGDQADDLRGDLALSLEHGHHVRDERVADDDDVRLVLVDDLQQQVGDQLVRLDHCLCHGVALVGDAVELAVDRRRFRRHDMVALAHGFVIKLADRFQTVDDRYLGLGTERTDFCLDRGGCTLVTAACGGGKNQYFHMFFPLAGHIVSQNVYNIIIPICS